MAKPQGTEAKLEEKSADSTVAAAMAAMEAQIAALSKQNEALLTRLSDVGHPTAENEKSTIAIAASSRSTRADTFSAGAVIPGLPAARPPRCV